MAVTCGADRVGNASRRNCATDIRSEMSLIFAFPSGVFADGQVTQSAICLRQVATSPSRLVRVGAAPGVNPEGPAPRLLTIVSSSRQSRKRLEAPLSAPTVATLALNPGVHSTSARGL